MKDISNMAFEPFIFVRKEGFYVIEIPRETVLDNVICNPGTIRVEDFAGNILFEEKE